MSETNEVYNEEAVAPEAVAPEAVAPEAVRVTSITCPNCKEEIVYEVPVRKARGVLAGKTVEEMSFDELKIEKRNASSVLYKAKQRGANPAIIEANIVRVNAVLAEIDKRITENPELNKIVRKPIASKTTEVLAVEVPTEEVNEEVNPEVATEI